MRLTGTRAISFLAICGLALACAGSFHNTARAAECDLSTPIANLESVKNDTTLSDRARLVKELGIRKQALKQVVQCATDNASALKDKLDNATTSDSTAAHLQ